MSLPRPASRHADKTGYGPKVQAGVEKPVEYWRVSSLPDGSIDWKQIEDIVPTPEVFEDGSEQRAYGELVIENDRRILTVITGDKEAHERVSKGIHKAAAIANEAERKRRERTTRRAMRRINVFEGSPRTASSDRVYLSG